MSPAPLSAQVGDRVRDALCIEGSWGPARSGESFAVTDPATGTVIAEVSNAGAADAVRAMDAAAVAEAEWAATVPRHRSDILCRAFAAVHARGDELAAVITGEMGKPLPEARAEVAYGAEFLRWFAEEAVRVYGRSVQLPEGGGEFVVRRRPVGPCYLITPWNFPLAMITRKVGPALAAGCPVIVKPAEATPLTAMLMVEILHDAGVPPGVVNLLTSDRPAEITATLFDDPRLRKVSFTGSTAVGRTLLRQAADRVVRSGMELGGNAPFLVLEGADVDAAVDGAMTAKFRAMGQACTAANRFLVHESLVADFGAELAQRAGELTVGPGIDPDTAIGPLITPAAVDRALGLVDAAVAAGARVLTGGRRIDRPGNFLEPTVLTGVGAGSPLVADEVFAPVAPIVGFASTREAVQLANDTEYGLAGYVFGPDIGQAHAVAQALDVGMVGVNVGIVSNAAAPFGGVKSSGLGREGGAEGIDEYLATQFAVAPAAAEHADR